MTYRMAIIGIVSMSLLSGCFSLSSPDLAPEITQKTSGSAQETLVDVDNKASEESVEPNLAQQLLVKEDLYEINKKPLTKQQKAYMIQAIEALQAKRVANGLAKIAAAEAMGALSSSAYVIKADLLAANDDPSASKLALQEALEVNPYNPKAANRLATLYREQGQFDTALVYYTRAINAVPMYAPSYRNRGILNDLYILDKASALDDYQTYSALLEYENERLQSKDVKKSIKLVKRWIVDVDRQLQRAARNANDS